MNALIDIQDFRKLPLHEKSKECFTKGEMILIGNFNEMSYYQCFRYGEFYCRFLFYDDMIIGCNIWDLDEAVKYIVPEDILSEL